MENMSYWKEVREFRKQLKKVIIPFEKFFRINEKNIKSQTIIDEVSKIEI
ncbi:MAG: hypothetical protein ACFFEY_15940 [Candidatus Thorarchaeota archaeon]